MTTCWKSIPPFTALPSLVLEWLERESHELRVSKGHVFFSEGEQSHEVHVVLSGRVQIQHQRADGSVRTVCMIGRGDIFCCLPILDQGPYPATAVAAVPTTTRGLSTATYRQLILQHPVFAGRTLCAICRTLRQVGCRDGGTSAGGRLAEKLIAMADKFGEDVPLTRRELAELAGTTVETAIREIKRFERRGWVALGRGHVRIRDRSALRRRSVA